ncbi:MAG: lysophospholipid acyltransferase family protein [Aquabacterium sp.]|uniref:lysophospholipid acyltransferase family protein n=1 Tax=Aquabacterium sp. TaxID=1872578 RepID=UPI00272183CC|nr:lysophospholipid acyltransferase family protein [Aquabacterium sp.]MDO9006491.1 lysophospholipid acyltransferase family protein [Aquabacterium sp.]
MSRAWSTWVLGPWRLFNIVVHIVRGLWLARIAYVDRPATERDEAVRHWSQQLLKVLGVTLVVKGHPRPGAKLVVSNHVSWLDIVAINSVVPSRFVSKAEVAAWPVVGYMVTAAGTLYLQRERRRDAMRVLGLMSDALREGYTVAVFPEGTTGDGHQLLHFHANMLQSAIDAKEPVQPLALRYSDEAHDISPAAAFVGDTTLWQSLWGVITARQLTVQVTVMPLQAVDHADRRALAELLSTQIADCLERN